MANRCVRVILLPDSETVHKLDESTILETDAHGNLCAITIEYASIRADAPHLTYEEIAA
jgi:uncharacterized protein YuzE